MSSPIRRLRRFRLALGRELAGQFRVAATHPGVERILDETEAHLEEMIGDLVDEGASEDSATAAALSRFGTPYHVARAYKALGAPVFVDPNGQRSLRGRLAEATRTGPIGKLLAGLSRSLTDLGVTLRGLARTPGYTAAFVLTLGLGIGANTAIFSVVHGVWLRALPYQDGDRLVYLRHSAPRAGIDNALFSVPEIDDYRQQSPSLDGVAEFSTMTFTMLGLDEPRRVNAGVVTGNYFEVMGLGARLGRVLASDDDDESAASVVVLTYESWRRLFGGDPEVLGRRLIVNGQSVEIVGVAEPAPPYPERTDVYVNMAVSPHHLSASMTDDRFHRMTEVFARLRPDASLATVRAEVGAITQRMHDGYPEVYKEAHGYDVSVVGLREQLAAEARPTMMMLLGVAAFVLVIACANVANLTLTRVMRRYDEWTLRVSLGAKPWTLRRQLLVENLVPSIGGALLGVLLAVLGVDLLAAYIARYSTRAGEITVDTTVLGVALAAAVVAATLFAFLPRLPGTSTRGSGWLSGTRSTAGVAGRRVQRLLVVSQVGVCFALLVGAALLLETLRNLQDENGGVALEEVLTMRVPTDYGARSVADETTFYQQLLSDVRTIPGVRSAALGSMIPLKEAPSGISASVAAMRFEVEGRAFDPSAPVPRADFRIVTDGYFETLGMSLLDGRSFQASDDRSSEPVLVVNQAFADYYFPDRSAVGQRIGWRGETLHFMGITEEPRTIVGVVSDAKEYGVAEDVPHVVFNPFRQVSFASSLFVRTAQPEAVTRPILERIRELRPSQPVEDIATLASIRSESISPQKLNAALVGAFALLALAVAAVGVAGVLAFGVSQRTHEFGIRGALGASRAVLVGVVLKEGAWLAFSGLALGVLASLLLGGLISGLLHDVAATDIGTMAVVGTLLTLVALLASAVPAWRAAEIDPVEALREE